MGYHIKTTKPQWVNPGRAAMGAALWISDGTYSSLSAPFLFGSSTNASVSCSSDIPCRYGFNGGGLQKDPFLNIRKSSVLHLVGASPYEKKQKYFYFGAILHHYA